MLTREERMKLALELTRMVWDLKHAEQQGESRSDLILDVFETCYRKMETLDTGALEVALEVSVIEEPVVPAD